MEALRLRLLRRIVVTCDVRAREGVEAADAEGLPPQ